MSRNLFCVRDKTLTVKHLETCPPQPQGLVLGRHMENITLLRRLNKDGPINGRNFSVGAQSDRGGDSINPAVLYSLREQTSPPCTFPEPALQLALTSYCLRGSESGANRRLH